MLKKHPGTIRRWIRERKLPVQKLGGKYGIYLISRSDALEFMMQASFDGRKITQKEKEKEEEMSISEKNRPPKVSLSTLINDELGPKDTQEEITNLSINFEAMDAIGDALEKMKRAIKEGTITPNEGEKWLVRYRKGLREAVQEEK